MNRSVCEKCRRFCGAWPGNENFWACAKLLSEESSDVIPEHNFLQRDQLHPIGKESRVPEWCEKPLEQTILLPEERAEVRKDSMISWDGNKRAERRAKDTIERRRW